MNPNRRIVLKSLAAAGITISGASMAKAGSVLTSSGSGYLPFIPIVSQGALDAPFLAGVRSAIQQGPSGPQSVLHINGFDAAIFARLNAVLRSGNPARLVGFTDTATATLVLDLIRSADGQLVSMEHHKVTQGPEAAAWAYDLGAKLVAGFSPGNIRPLAPLAGTAPGMAGAACVSFSCVI